MLSLTSVEERIKNAKQPLYIEYYLILDALQQIPTDVIKLILLTWCTIDDDVKNLYCDKMIINVYNIMMIKTMTVIFLGKDFSFDDGGVIDLMYNKMTKDAFYPLFNPITVNGITTTDIQHCIQLPINVHDKINQHYLLLPNNTVKMYKNGIPSLKTKPCYLVDIQHLLKNKND